MTTTKDAKGGINGEDFDDGVNDYVRKVIVGEDSDGVRYVKIEYVKDGQVVERVHGRNTGTETTETEFEVNYPDEYITLIRGNLRMFKRPVHFDNIPIYDSALSELQFKTSYGRTSQVFGKPDSPCTEFVLEGNNGTKLVGLHGRDGDCLWAIGAHFISVSSVFKQLKPLGGPDGVSWDDGVYDCVREVRVGEDGDRVSSVEFVYGKGGQSITHRHGKQLQERKVFVLDHENDEYIKAIKGYRDADGFVSSLTFRTSKDKDSEKFGTEVGTRFVLRAYGFNKLVGFRGRSTLDRINALGANFSVVVAPPVRKLEAKGVDSGNDWDDGIHDYVHKIWAGDDGSNGNALRFSYVDDNVKGNANARYQYVCGANHGKIDCDNESEEVKFWWGIEYITSVKGHYGKKLPLAAGTSRELAETSVNQYITMLKFNTNRKNIYQVIGSDSDDDEYEYVGTPFELGETGHVIVGFHGKSSDRFLQQLGVYVKPIDKPDEDPEVALRKTVFSTDG